jgi:hypothetical protein
MAQTTEVHEPAHLQTPTPKSKSVAARVWFRIKLVVTRSIFWEYGRGSWQYDVIVTAILAFIFLSPRFWFNDRPTLQMTNLRNQQGIVEMSRVNKEVTYEVDARLAQSRGQAPEIAIPVILREHLHKTVAVKSIDAVVDRHQVILGYTVVVEE